MSSEPDDRTIPLWKEQINVHKTQVVTDNVRISTRVEEHPVLIEDAVERGDLIVERVAVERAVAAAPEPRQEGDTLIVSIVEERLIVEKRLFVIEELRITSISTRQHVAIPETIRSMHATVERDPIPTTGSEIDG